MQLRVVLKLRDHFQRGMLVNALLHPVENEVVEGPDLLEAETLLLEKGVDDGEAVLVCLTVKLLLGMGKGGNVLGKKPTYSLKKCPSNFPE